MVWPRETTPTLLQIYGNLSICNYSMYIILYSFLTDPPSTIASITANDASCLITNAIVSWDPSTSDPVCGPVSYNVTISPSDGVVVMIINDTSYNFTALTPGTNYTVTVAGNNMAGVGESNMTIFNIITMTEALPSGELILYVFVIAF